MSQSKGLNIKPSAQPPFGMSQNPIHDMHFQGLHWIEASAGSGKTYTLSSLMVRILMDAYVPKQVIATTFTRAAAAELKTRIRLRLQEAYRFLNSQRELTASQNMAQAAQQSDPLFAKLQLDFAARIGYGCDRLKLVMQQLDELFVGTLDSFSQKLLREFAFESGRTEALNISDEPKQYSLELIHDTLRQWIQSQPQSLIDWLNAAKQIHSPEHYLAVVENALNFSAAHWPQPATQALDFGQLLHSLACVDVNEIAAMPERLQLSSSYIPFANGKYYKKDAFKNIFEVLFPEWLDCLQHDLTQEQRQLAVWQYYVQHQSRWDKLFEHYESDVLFKKELNEGLKKKFYNDTGVRALFNLIQICQQIQQSLSMVAGQLQRHLCQAVAQQLPAYLQQQQETTFAVQIQTLAAALQGQHGVAFANAVHSRYPLILVDEFQDTNFEQDQMLRSIWRQPARLNLGCMIMVGDRKQAIYGFRGGDMLTFIQAYNEVQQKQGRFYELVFNHRSVAPLVQAVDALMQAQPDFGEHVGYRPVQAGPRPHPALCDATGTNPNPLVWFEVDKAQEPEQVAWQILQLLQQSAAGEVFFADPRTPEQRVPLQEDDFAVLATSHRQLDAVQQALAKLQIRVHRPSKRSVFDSSSAVDVAAILLALQQPYDEARLKRALLTRMLGFNLSQLQQLEAEPDGLSAWMAQFDALQKRWREQGFMAAWQQLLTQMQVWQNVVATQADDNERCVVNLRHLTELLQQHSQQYGGIQRLLNWYLTQLQSPAQRDWEMERKLSKAAGVQLLSIHQSKGLEFKIVFLLGVNKKPKSQTDALVLSTAPMLSNEIHQPHIAAEAHLQQPQQSQQQQRVIQVSSDPTVDDAAKQAHQARKQAETNRLWYVAITRASHRVYAMWHRDAPEDIGLGFWRSSQPVALLSRVQTALSACPDWAMPKPVAADMPIQVDAWPSRGFYPHSQTSFTALAPQHAASSSSLDLLAMVLEQPSPSDDELLDQPMALNEGLTVATTTIDQACLLNQDVFTQPATTSITTSATELPSVATALPWIAAHFPKGAQAGNFFHELLEGIDFQAQSTWTEQLRRRFDNQYPAIKAQLWQRYREHFTLPEPENLSNSAADADATSALAQQDQAIQSAIYPQMLDWLQQIMHTPIHDDFCLAQLAMSARVAEFSFDLGLAAQRFQSQQLQQLLNAYLQPQFGITLPMLQDAFSARYLTGSIDLLYWHNSRFYIADYKSNFLGSKQTDYAALAIQRNMTEACYWLQAALYLLAVHRYLSRHWPDYRITEHLGGASYLYVRGMQGQADYGVLHWSAAPELILALDAALGYAPNAEPRLLA